MYRINSKPERPKSNAELMLESYMANPECMEDIRFYERWLKVKAALKIVAAFIILAFSCWLLYTSIKYPIVSEIISSIFATIGIILGSIFVFMSLLVLIELIADSISIPEWAKMEITLFSRTRQRISIGYRTKFDINYYKKIVEQEALERSMEEHDQD